MAQPPPIAQPETAIVANKESDKNQTKKKQDIPIVESRTTDLEVDIQIERPEILLVEDIANPNSNSILLEMCMALKYSMLKDVDLINGEISGFHAVFCPFKEEMRQNNSMDIISPTKLSAYINKPINDGMQGTLTMEHLIINITPGVIQSISKIISTLQINNAEESPSKETPGGSKCQEIVYNNEFWEMKKFQDTDYLFISKGLKEKVNETDDTVDSAYDVVRDMGDSDRRHDQKTDDRNKLCNRSLDNIFFRLPDIKVILESEVAKKCIPMFIVECSIDGKLKNPSTQFCFGATVCVSISYFNDHINVWEPIIEVYPEENNRLYSFEIEYNTNDDKQEDEDDLDVISINEPAVSIALLSHDSLELTITKTAIDVLTNLAKAFEDAYALHLEEHRSVVGAPYVIKNTCGKDIVLYLTDDFDLHQCKADKDNKILLSDNEEVHLYDASIEKSLITDEKQAVYIKFGFADSELRENLSIDKSEVRGFNLISTKTTESESSEKDINTLVVSTSAYLGMKNLDIRSILQVFNNTQDVLSLYYKLNNKPECKEYVFMLDIAPDKNYNVPISILLKCSGCIYLKPKELNTEISSVGASWGVGKDNHLENQILECKTNSDVVYYYSVALTHLNIPVGNLSEELVLRTCRLDIFVPLALHNQLPIAFSYQSHVFSQNVEPGCHEFIKTATINVQFQLKINFEHQHREWFGTLELGPKTEELSVINFKAKEGFEERVMVLGVHLLKKCGHVAVTIYSPYWMINKTGHTLTYKVGDDYQVEHDANNNDAILFSFLSTSMFNKKKRSASGYSLQTIDVAESQYNDSQSDQINSESTNITCKNLKFAKSIKAYLKIKDSLWSDKFSLDTVGSSGKVVCKKKPVNYEVAVKINLSSSGLTKIVTFLPYYMILNQSSVILYCNETVDDAVWITIPPGEAVPFWPKSEVGKSMMMYCKVEDSDNLITSAFPFYESHSTLMKLDRKYIGVFVEVQITEEANLINLQLYQKGMALAKLVNHLGDNVAIHYKQHGTTKEFTLLPYHSIMYAWQDTTQKHELIWRVEGEKKKQHSNSLISDGIEAFFINEMKAYWSSFVWENERILLFTNDTQVAKYAGFSADLESTSMDITLSLYSIGLSLVNNSSKEELAYISVTNSGVKWNQIRKKYRQKPLKLAQSEALEAHFEDFSNKMRVGSLENKEYIVHVDGLEVDLATKRMLKPDKCELVRVFEPGVFLQYQTSPHKIQIHLRIHKVQIDNQMTYCGFPVVFAPFPPPRSVALDTGLKPFIELSSVIIKSDETGSMRFKYFRVLIQEMQLMLDQAFVNSLLDFISGSVPVYDEETMLKKDCQIIRESLIDTPTIKSILQGGIKYAFDDFHISPIKIHLSFSLSNVGRSGKTALHSEVLNLFLQSVGIVITDMQDVIFKLGYFEKKSCLMPTNQMVSSITSHYVSQALRQMYVLVLGLDVLGNPFGVIRGMAQGVEDLFYEPIRGAILGPEEFVDGIAYGVKSLFGHAVGGAAGAVSRIVGTMGKGIAALTLDADYQRQRREQLAKRPENLGVGLAQGGKGLIFGIVHGVTGVVTKPIDGAKKEGVEGFFKGVGKGLVGVVTRPVSGVVDFASSSFEGIRRVADTNIEVVRVRPPRYIANDGIVRSYALRKAEGNNIWNKVKEKSNPLLNESYIFHVNCKTKKNVIFLTNERIFHLERNDILGIWSIQWQIAYNKLDGAPTINSSRTAIVFTLKEKQRKLFSKDNITKEIEASVEAINIVIKKVTKIQKVLEKQKSFC